MIVTGGEAYRSGDAVTPGGALDPTKREKLEARLKHIGLTDESIRSIWLDPVATLPPGSRPKYIYLDLNHWITLAKTRVGRPDGAAFQNCYQILRAGVARGQLVLPLTATIYMEVTNTTQVRHRTDVADVMAEISRFKVIAGSASRLRSEVEAALHTRFGRPRLPYKLQPFGTGCLYAFDGEDGPIGRIVAKDKNTGLSTEVDDAEFAELDMILNQLAEYLLLRGPRPEDLARMPDYDPHPAQLIARERADREQQLFELRAIDRTVKNRLSDIVHARVLYWDAGPALPQLLARADLSIDSFLAQGKEWISAFIDDVPLLSIQVSLTTQLLKNSSRPWSDNDIYDIDSLGAAVPYCDVVVTEKHACHILNKSGIATRLNTKVICKLSELEALLAAS